MPGKEQVPRVARDDNGCSNCGSPLVSAFCADCGERQPSSADYSTRHLVTEAFHELANVDGRLWRSVVALLSKPVFLTAEYFAGRRGLFYFTAFSTFGWALLSLLYKASPLARPAIRFLSGDAGIFLTLAVAIVPYLTFGLRRFYGSSLLSSIPRAFVLFVAFQALILVFRNVLFHTALRLV